MAAAHHDMESQADSEQPDPVGSNDHVADKLERLKLAAELDRHQLVEKIIGNEDINVLDDSAGDSIRSLLMREYDFSEEDISDDVVAHEFNEVVHDMHKEAEFVLQQRRSEAKARLTEWIQELSVDELPDARSMEQHIREEMLAVLGVAATDDRIENAIRRVHEKIDFKKIQEDERRAKVLQLASRDIDKQLGTLNADDLRNADFEDRGVFNAAMLERVRDVIEDVRDEPRAVREAIERDLRAQIDAMHDNWLHNNTVEDEEAPDAKEEYEQGITTINKALWMDTKMLRSMPLDERAYRARMHEKAERALADLPDDSKFRRYADYRIRRGWRKIMNTAAADASNELDDVTLKDVEKFSPGSKDDFVGALKRLSPTMARFTGTIPDALSRKVDLKFNAWSALRTQREEAAIAKAESWAPSKTYESRDAFEKDFVANVDPEMRKNHAPQFDAILDRKWKRHEQDKQKEERQNDESDDNATSVEQTSSPAETSSSETKQERQEKDRARIREEREAALRNVTGIDYSTIEGLNLTDTEFNRAVGRIQSLTASPAVRQLLLGGAEYFGPFLMTMAARSTDFNATAQKLSGETDVRKVPLILMESGTNRQLLSKFPSLQAKFNGGVELLKIDQQKVDDAEERARAIEEGLDEGVIEEEDVEEVLEDLEEEEAEEVEKELKERDVIEEDEESQEKEETDDEEVEEDEVETAEKAAEVDQEDTEEIEPAEKEPAQEFETDAKSAEEQPEQDEEEDIVEDQGRDRKDDEELQTEEPQAEADAEGEEGTEGVEPTDIRLDDTVEVSDQQRVEDEDESDLIKDESVDDVEVADAETAAPLDQMEPSDALDESDEDMPADRESLDEEDEADSDIEDVTKDIDEDTDQTIVTDTEDVAESGADEDVPSAKVERADREEAPEKEQEEEPDELDRATDVDRTEDESVDFATKITDTEPAAPLDQMEPSDAFDEGDEDMPADREEDGKPEETTEDTGEDEGDEIMSTDQEVDAKPEETTEGTGDKETIDRSTTTDVPAESRDDITAAAEEPDQIEGEAQATETDEDGMMPIEPLEADQELPDRSEAEVDRDISTPSVEATTPVGEPVDDIESDEEEATPDTEEVGTRTDEPDTEQDESVAAPAEDEEADIPTDTKTSEEAEVPEVLSDSGEDTRESEDATREIETEEGRPSLDQESDDSIDMPSESELPTDEESDDDESIDAPPLQENAEAADESESVFEEHDDADDIRTEERGADSEAFDATEETDESPELDEEEVDEQDREVVPDESTGETRDEFEDRPSQERAADELIEDDAQETVEAAEGIEQDEQDDIDEALEENKEDTPDETDNEPGQAPSIDNDSSSPETDESSAPLSEEDQDGTPIRQEITREADVSETLIQNESEILDDEGERAPATNESEEVSAMQEVELQEPTPEPDDEASEEPLQPESTPVEPSDADRGEAEPRSQEPDRETQKVPEETDDSSPKAGESPRDIETNEDVQPPKRIDDDTLRSDLPPETVARERIIDQVDEKSDTSREEEAIERSEPTEAIAQERMNQDSAPESREERTEEDAEEEETAEEADKQEQERLRKEEEEEAEKAAQRLAAIRAIDADAAELRNLEKQELETQTRAEAAYLASEAKREEEQLKKEEAAEDADADDVEQYDDASQAVKQSELSEDVVIMPYILVRQIVHKVETYANLKTGFYVPSSINLAEETLSASVGNGQTVLNKLIAHISKLAVSQNKIESLKFTEMKSSADSVTISMEVTTEKGASAAFATCEFKSE